MSLTTAARRRSLCRAFVTIAACAWMASATAQTEGGLYIAGAGFSFQAAAERAIAGNAGGGRFFLLALPPETAALALSAGAAQTALRNRVTAAGGVLMVCQRDIDDGRVAAARLARGVVAVRGWPRPGQAELPAGQRYFSDEDPGQLPAANEALRQLRSTCT